jgi:uncharacterized protein YcnI
MKRLRVLALTGAVAAAGLVVLAGPASAHVTVSAPGATRGGSDQEITFRVPVEKKVDTVGLKVALPVATPIASVDVQATAGWTHREKSVKLAQPIHTDDGDLTEAVSEVDWTAQPGRGLTPGEFGAFTIIAGQLPDAASLTFKVIQVYSDGSTVSWIETAAPGGNADTLEHPAPTLALAKPTAAGGGATSAPAAASTSSSKSSNTGPVVLSIIALVIAAAALGVGIVTRAGRRS